MALKIKLSKADFDALDESLKTLYVPDGENFKLDADYEDVDGLKAKRDELLKDLKAKQDLLKQFEGLDPAAAKEAMDKLAAAEEDKLTKKGEWDKLKEALDARHKAELDKAKSESTKILSNLKREKLTNYLVEKGVLPDRAKYLINDLDAQIELATDDNGFSLKKIGGIGDAVELEAILESTKQASPFFFAASGASGSGASGSNGQGGSTAKTWTRGQWDNASSEDRAAFSAAKGQVRD